MEHDKLLDKVITHFTQPTYKQDIELAKRDFFGYLPPSDENSDQFDIQMSQFLDWYIFDYHLKQTGLTPIEDLMESKEIQEDLKINTDELSILKNLSCHHHSLFEFIKADRDTITIKDLIINKKTQVDKTPKISYLKKNECFETRIVLINKTYQVLNGICVHPTEARKFLLDQVNKVRKSGEYEQKEMLRKLTKMYLKFHQFPHIKIEYIYTDNSKMRL